MWTIKALSIVLLLLLFGSCSTKEKDKKTLVNTSAVAEFEKGQQIQYGSSKPTKASVSEAIEHYKRALEIDPTYLFARKSLAMTLLANGWTEEAREQLMLALRLSPKDPQIYFLLGVVGKQKDDKQTEKKAFQQSIEIYTSLIEKQDNFSDRLNRAYVTGFLHGEKARLHELQKIDTMKLFTKKKGNFTLNNQAYKEMSLISNDSLLIGMLEQEKPYRKVRLTK